MPFQKIFDPITRLFLEDRTHFVKQPWVQWTLFVMLMIVSITTLLFCIVHWLLHITFNSAGEGPYRVALCTVYAVMYTIFLGFLAFTMACFLMTKDFSPSWMAGHSPIALEDLQRIFIGIIIFYSVPIILSSITTACVFIRDRIRAHRLHQQRKRDPKALTDKDPHVVVLVPVYKEPLSNLLSTINAIAESDYPQAKLHVIVGFDDYDVLTTMNTIKRIMLGEGIDGYDVSEMSRMASVGTPGAGRHGPGSPRTPLLGSYSDCTGAGVDPHNHHRGGSNGSDSNMTDVDDTSDSAGGDLGAMSGGGNGGYTASPRTSIDSSASQSAPIKMAKRKFKYNGFSQMALRAYDAESRQSLPSLRQESPEVITLEYRGIDYSICRFQHGGKLHTQSKMFEMIQKEVNVGVYPSNSLLLFVDSDTTLIPSTVRRFVDSFHLNPQRKAATGFIVSRNGHGFNFWQKFQDAEYIFMQASFRYTEAALGGVTCLPGALTMVEYQTMTELAKIYFHQPAVDSTFEFCRRKLGEDRFLSHLAMEKCDAYAIGFVPDALSKTEAPGTFYNLLRQRRRWLLGSLTNEVYMFTTPSFNLKYPALMGLRVLFIFRLGGTVFYLFLLEFILLMLANPESFTPWTMVLACVVPVIGWIMLMVWSVWQRRWKNLFFFLFYWLAAMMLELLYYMYTIWTIKEKTWGGPRSAPKGDEEQPVELTPQSLQSSPRSGHALDHSPEFGAQPQVHPQVPQVQLCRPASMAQLPVSMPQASRGQQRPRSSPLSAPKLT